MLGTEVPSAAPLHQAVVKAEGHTLPSGMIVLCTSEYKTFVMSKLATDVSNATFTLIVTLTRPIVHVWDMVIYQFFRLCSPAVNMNKLRGQFEASWNTVLKESFVQCHNLLFLIVVAR